MELEDEADLLVAQRRELRRRPGGGVLAVDEDPARRVEGLARRHPLASADRARRAGRAACSCPSRWRRRSRRIRCDRSQVDALAGCGWRRPARRGCGGRSARATAAVGAALRGRVARPGVAVSDGRRATAGDRPIQCAPRITSTGSYFAARRAGYTAAISTITIDADKRHDVLAARARSSAALRP